MDNHRWRIQTAIDDRTWYRFLWRRIDVIGTEKIQIIYLSCYRGTVVDDNWTDRRHLLCSTNRVLGYEHSFDVELVGRDIPWTGVDIWDDLPCRAFLSWIKRSLRIDEAVYALHLIRDDDISSASIIILECDEGTGREALWVRIDILLIEYDVMPDDHERPLVGWPCPVEIKGDIPWFIHEEIEGWVLIRERRIIDVAAEECDILVDIVHDLSMLGRGEYIRHCLISGLEYARSGDIPEDGDLSDEVDAETIGRDTWLSGRGYRTSHLSVEWYPAKAPTPCESFDKGSLRIVVDSSWCWVDGWTAEYYPPSILWPGTAIHGTELIGIPEDIHGTDDTGPAGSLIMVVGGPPDIPEPKVSRHVSGLIDQAGIPAIGTSELICDDAWMPTSPGRLRIE